MKKKYLTIVVLIMSLLFALCIQVYSLELPLKLLSITSFKLNNGANSTASTTVTLNHTLQGSATHYRASQREDFADAQWKAYSAGTVPTINLSSGSGSKTVYFQVKNDPPIQRGNASFSNIVSDSIMYMPMVLPGTILVPVTIPPQIESLGVSIDYGTPSSGVYNMGISYSIKVNDVPVDPGLKIDLKVIPVRVDASEGAPLVTKEITYNDGQKSGSSIYHSGQLTFYLDPRDIGPSDQGGVTGGIIPSNQIQVIKIQAKIRRPNGSVKFREIRWRTKTVIEGKYIEKCDGPLGDSGDWSFNISSKVPAFAFVGGRMIDLKDCGQVREPGNEKKCDRDPSNTMFGEWGVRWVTKPSDSNKGGTIHWWCEGYSNPQPQGTVATSCSRGTDGRMSCYGWPKFVFNAFIDTFEPYVVP